MVLPTDKGRDADSTYSCAVYNLCYYATDCRAKCCCKLIKRLFGDEFVAVFVLRAYLESMSKISVSLLRNSCFLCIELLMIGLLVMQCRLLLLKLQK